MCLQDRLLCKAYISKKKKDSLTWKYNTVLSWLHQHLSQCWKFPQVRRSEADNFGGGPETFCWFFFKFMFMIWDSRHEDLQLFRLSFKHWFIVFIRTGSAGKWLNSVLSLRSPSLPTVTPWWLTTLRVSHDNLPVDGLMQERRNSIANALKLRLSCTNPSQWRQPYSITYVTCQNNRVILKLSLTLTSRKLRHSSQL